MNGFRPTKGWLVYWTAMLGASVALAVCVWLIVPRPERIGISLIFVFIGAAMAIGSLIEFFVLPRIRSKYLAASPVAVPILGLIFAWSVLEGVIKGRTGIDLSVDWSNMVLGLVGLGGLAAGGMLGWLIDGVRARDGTGSSQ